MDKSVFASMESHIYPAPSVIDGQVYLPAVRDLFS